MILPLLLTMAVGQAPQTSASQEMAPVGREAAEALEFPPLTFEPPEVREHDVLGVPVLHLEDPTLPLVDVQLLMRGGVAHFPREDLAAVSAFPVLLRTGGTREMPADSVDRAIDLLGLQLSMGSGGGGTTVSLNALSNGLEPALELLREILLEPRFAPGAIEVWRGQQLERIRRREENPAALAFAEFNRLMYGDHPVGWLMDEGDLSPDRLSADRLRSLHEMLVCRERLILGLSGDVLWDDARPLVDDFLAAWPACPAELPDPPPADVRREPGVFVYPLEIDQSTIVAAQASGIRQGDSPEYFASRISDFVLGGGGFTSRILSRVRSEEGLAYGAASVWTAPNRHDGLLGAFTATSPATTLEATTLLLDIFREFRDAPPTEAEVRDAANQIALGYVFAFESPSQIVARRIAYRAQGLPENWLSRYLEGLGEVTTERVAAVVRDHLDPDRMTILMVGDPSRFDPGLEAFDAVYELAPDGSFGPWEDGTR